MFLSTLTICLLSDVVRLFIFEVNIDIAGLISTMFVTAYYSLHLFFFLSFSAFSN